MKCDLLMPCNLLIASVWIENVGEHCQAPWCHIVGHFI